LIVPQLTFNAKLAEQMEVVYRSRDIRRRRRHVYDALEAAPGERILDAGCGPGFYTAELLDQVGEDGFVVAVDASPQMLAVAEHRSAGRANVSFDEADVTSLPVEDASVDRAVSVQVLEYVIEVDMALAEMLRVLRPGGRAVIWDVDWKTVSWYSEDPARMQRMLAAWDEHLMHVSLPQTLARRMRAAGFENVRMEAHAFASTELTPDAYGSALLPLMRDYVAGVEGIGAVAADEWVTEQHELQERGDYFFACTQFCFSGDRAG
jgi:arsenite methyltransferase